MSSTHPVWVGKTISMDVYLPAPLLAVSYSVQVVIQAGTGPATYEGWVTSGLTTGWNTLTYVVPDNPDTQYGIVSIGLGIQLLSGSGMAAPADMFIDNIKIN
jgi:hypothetical protein